METERLILRGWTEEDAEALFRYARDPEVGPVAGWAPHESVDYSREIIRTVFASPEVYAVVLKESGEPVGCCGLVPFGGNPTDVSTAAEAEIGYWIGKPFWGHGLIPEAVNALLTRAFTQLNLTTVWGVVYDGNLRSQRVLEKCGFKYHHTAEPAVSPLGDVRTEHFFRITEEDRKAKS